MSLFRSSKPAVAETVISTFANGCVNLIGDETPGNDGWVLPTAIPQKTEVKLRLRDDQQVVARSTVKGAGEATYILGAEKRTGQWFDHLQGATKIVREELAKRSGGWIRGFGIDINSNVAVGSSLASRAAFKIAVLKAIREAFGLKFDDVELAKIGHRIETEFISGNGAENVAANGATNVGITDQMVCAVAKYGEALVFDTKTLHFEKIKFPLDELDLVVINSGVEHQLAGRDYGARVLECKSACFQLDLPSLRDATVEMIALAVKAETIGAIEAKRARHVVTENTRVHEAVGALKAGDFVRLGKLFRESHRSMKSDYEMSVPEADLLVDLCGELGSIFGARLLGGGSGGSIVAIARKGEGLMAAQTVVEKYQRATSQKATILVP